MNLKADYVIINYSYSYCDHCLKQLDDLVKLKQNSKKDIKVIAIFTEKTENLTEIIKKYSKNLLISSDGRKWVAEFNFGVGSPMSYVLDKNKIVVEADPLNYNDQDSFAKLLEKIK
ncbi:MAG: redoxin domain-containing protein [Bacteroidota bacterium]|nr:redoxin domain-containing protein [Bacteroidota bacterium]